MSPDAMNVSFLVDNFADRVPGVRHTALVAGDGLLVAVSRNLDRAGADRFAAAASGLTALAAGAAEPFGGGHVAGLIIELERGFIFVSGIGDGLSLAVMADARSDVGSVGYEMARLIEQCAPVLTPSLSAELQGALAL